MTIRRAVLALTVPTLVVALSACAPGSAEPDETFVPAPPTESEPEPDLAPNPIEEDTTLIVRATATDASGAQLSLELQAHRASPWEYLGTRTLATAILDDCGEPLTAEVFESERWSFTRANVTAIPTPDSTSPWPGTSLVTVEPGSANETVAGRGILAADCTEPKALSAAGRGALSLGIPSDAGALTGWALRSWGFVAGSGVTLSDCSVELTAHGQELTGGAAWTQAADATACTTGP